MHGHNEQEKSQKNKISRSDATENGNAGGAEDGTNSHDPDGGRNGSGGQPDL